MERKESSQQDQTLLASLPGIGDAFLENRSVKYVRKHFKYFLVPIFLAAMLGVWYLVIEIWDFPQYLVPPPPVVARKFIKVIENGSLLRHVRVTLTEASLGFIGALSIASIFGYVMAKSRFLERLVGPYLVAGQTVPLLAIAPVLIVWLGFGLASKVFIALVIVFFPMLVNVIIGIRLVNEDQRELMRSYSASPLQVFRLLEFPSALPVLLGALKIGVTTAISGAMVGEYVGSFNGIGFMIILAKNNLDTPGVFVTIIVLVVLNVSLYSIVTLIENVLLSGRKRD